MFVTTTLLCLPEIEVNPYQLDEHISNIRNHINHVLLRDRDENHKSIIGYPKVQFRSYENRLALFGINEGSTLLNDFAFINQLLELYKTEQIITDLTTPINKIGAKENQTFRYKITDYLPFNEDYYSKWKNINGFVDRMTFLQDELLKKHVANFCEDLDYTPKEEITVKLLNFIKRDAKKIKDVNFIRCHVAFETNVQLPEYIGLGKIKSKGNGVLRYFDE
jgi:hypothetical protein